MPPSSQKFNKNQREKLASQTSKLIDDDEADADTSEPNSESDLESLTGDDKIPTDPNPDEEDESHESLREQLEGIATRKRRHNELERRTVVARVASLAIAARGLKAPEETLNRALVAKAVKNEDDGEGNHSKKIKSERA